MATAMRDVQPIAAYIRLSGVSQRALANELGYSEQHLSAVVNGHTPASRRLRRALARTLDVPESDLFR